MKTKFAARTHLYFSGFILLAFAFVLQAEERVVWQIGKVDGTYDELAGAREGDSEGGSTYTTAFSNDVLFAVGKDHPSKSWSNIHPGPSDVWAHSKTHPFTIVFENEGRPEGVYRLLIHLIDTHAIFPPLYEININGIAGTIQLPAGSGDMSAFDPSKGRPHTINLKIPASWLHSGENRIVLKTVKGSWLLYDAVRLTYDPDAVSDVLTVNNITLAPTVCFVQRGSKLKQIVSINAQCSANGCLTAVVKYNREEQTVPLRSVFGTAAADIEVDETAKPTSMEVSIQSGGQLKTAACVIRPQKHWKLYVNPSAHADLGYTHFQEEVIVRHNNNTKKALELFRTYPHFKWNTEAGWIQDNFLAMMSDDLKEEYIRRAAEGRIGNQAIYANTLTGICSHEGLIRNFYYARATSGQYGIPFDIATQNDIPTQIWTLPTIIAGCGIHYFIASHNAIRADSCSRFPLFKPFFWQGPDGSRVLTWFSSEYAQASTLGLGLDLEVAKPGIEKFLRSFDREDYPWDAVLAVGGCADNEYFNPDMPVMAETWNKTYAYPKIIFCRGPEFFTYLESQFSDRIPTMIGDCGVYWEDGVGSTALDTALNRCTSEDLWVTEAMLSLGSVFGNKEYPSKDLKSVWKDVLLYYEHTWNVPVSEPESEMSVKQAAYKSKFATGPAKAVSALKSRGFAGLTGLVRVNEPSILVFNPASWPVTGVASAMQPDGKAVNFLADVPAMSIKAYPVSKLPKAVTPPVPSGNIMENRFYRLEVNPDSGVVTRLFDKELKRELIDSDAPYGLNQYLYVSGFAESAKDVARTGVSLPAKIVQQSRPGCTVMKIQTSAFNTPQLNTEIVLYSDTKRIDFFNTLNKTATYEKEAGYFAFPFLFRSPRFFVEIPNGVVRPDKDMLDGGCMAWYCAQDFVAVSDDAAAVVWTAVDSPLVTLNDINHEVSQGKPIRSLPPLSSAGTKWPVPLDKGYVYGYVFNNYWLTNYKGSQGGRLRFRFSLTSMKTYDPVAAKRFGQSVRNPLLAEVVQPGNAVEEKLPATFSFCSVSPENVAIQAVKRAESGEGLILRLREVGGKPASATINLPVGRFKNAWRCNLVEDTQSELQISKGRIRIELQANGLATVLVK